MQAMFVSAETVMQACKNDVNAMPKRAAAACSAAAPPADVEAVHVMRSGTIQLLRSYLSRRARSFVRARPTTSTELYVVQALAGLFPMCRALGLLCLTSRSLSSLDRS